MPTASETKRRKRAARTKPRVAALPPPALGPVAAAEAAIATRDGIREAERAAAARRFRERPLARYLARGYVTRAQHDAGERLRREWQSGQSDVPSSWPRDEPRASPGSRMLFGSCDADFRLALMAAGPVLARTLWRVAVLGHEPVAPAGCPRNDAIARLRAGLDALIIHYASPGVMTMSWLTGDMSFDTAYAS